MFPENSILLHICCGPCALGSIEQLRNDGYFVVGYFFNPNIYPAQEYQLRKTALERVEDILQVKIIKEKHNPQLFYQETKGLKHEKEGGERCRKCYYLRLKKTHEASKEYGIKYFATTLTISPHKDFNAITEIGKSIYDQGFLERNFKKNDGFKRSMELAKKLHIYRQSYCGCKYSMRK